jgi:hypothetical protein
VFVVLPVALGAIASWVLRPGSGLRAAGYGALAVMAALCFFLLAGSEGLICIAMALPLAVPLGALGGWLAYRAEASGLDTRRAALLLLLPPAGVAWDVKAPPPVYEVRSAVEIAAPPELVWKHMVTFAELPAPQEWFFQTGLAYPISARLDGEGAGAVRYCDLSTGPVVEPIEVWDPPRLLRFRVTESPAPMHELSFYAHVEPKHLHGYFISKSGQFQLTRLPGGRTLLEGTSWYQHGLWPAEYWSWWSDAIVRRIHIRVLTNIQKLAEADRSNVSMP